MKISRSTKCSLTFANRSKLSLLDTIMQEYAVVVNIFIRHFWSLKVLPRNGELLKPVVDLPSTWLSARLRKVAAREAIAMILAAKKRWGVKAVRPVHRGRRMCVSSTIASLTPATKAKSFDCWLHLSSIGNRITLDIPIKLHKHYLKLDIRGKRCESYIITRNSVQLAFEIETGPKQITGKQIGIDTGIKALASTSEGKQYGQDVDWHLDRIKRRKLGSKGQQRARLALKQRMNEVAKEVVTSDTKLVVVEQLKNLNYKTKFRRRLNRSMRRKLGSWAYSYWLGKVEQTCEDRRSAFRSVFPAYTSQQCPVCGHTERGNRNGEIFLCLNCGHRDNADINAAKNILNRFLTGPYGAGFKAAV